MSLKFYFYRVSFLSFISKVSKDKFPVLLFMHVLFNIMLRNNSRKFGCLLPKLGFKGNFQNEICSQK